MDTVGAYEAKTRLSELLDRVAKGEQITITRHGVPIAVLQPVAGSRTCSVREAIAQLLQFRRNHHLDGLTIREMIDEGRR